MLFCTKRPILLPSIHQRIIMWSKPSQWNLPTCPTHTLQYFTHLPNTYFALFYPLAQNIVCITLSTYPTHTLHYFTKCPTRTLYYFTFYVYPYKMPIFSKSHDKVLSALYILLAVLQVLSHLLLYLLTIVRISWSPARIANLASSPRVSFSISSNHIFLAAEVTKFTEVCIAWGIHSSAAEETSLLGF